MQDSACIIQYDIIQITYTSSCAALCLFCSTKHSQLCTAVSESSSELQWDSIRRLKAIKVLLWVFWLYYSCWNVDLLPRFRVLAFKNKSFLDLGSLFIAIQISHKKWHLHIYSMFYIFILFKLNWQCDFAVGNLEPWEIIIWWLLQQCRWHVIDSNSLTGYIVLELGLFHQLLNIRVKVSLINKSTTDNWTL